MSEEMEVACVGFINGTTMIGSFRKEDGAFADAFFISLVKNPESKERNFCFKPILVAMLDHYPHIFQPVYNWLANKGALK